MTFVRLYATAFPTLAGGAILSNCTLFPSQRCPQQESLEAVENLINDMRSRQTLFIPEPGRHHLNSARCTMDDVWIVC